MRFGRRTAKVMTTPPSSVVSLESMMAMFQQVLASSQSGASRNVRIELTVPTYIGPEDDKTPQDFLEELERYRLASQCSEMDLLQKILPTALKGGALRWFRFMENLDSLESFKHEFRTEFEALNYQDRLRMELKRRTQAPDEPLTAYIHAIAEYYRRLNMNSLETEKVQTVLSQCHPSYRPFLRGKSFTSLSELAKEAKTIQADLLSWHTYAPPPDPANCLEPSLAYKNPLSSISGTANSVASENQPRGDSAGSPTIGLAALDPFTHARLERTRRPGRDAAPRQLGPRQEPPVYHSQLTAPRRRCFGCGSEKHLVRFCRQKSENRN